MNPSVPTMTGPGGGFRPDIEGLRAIAILLVVGYHAGISFLSGGYVGVDVFFVLSGYLITGLLVREVDKTGTIDLASFYARRARRLLPALALTLLVTIVVSAAIYPPFEANQGGFGATAISTAAYASNLYFVTSATNYFGANREKNPLLHTWSLSVEEQFYLAWPLFVMFGLGIARWQRHRAISHGRLVWWMAGAIGLSFGLSLYLTQVRQPWAYFLSPTRAWEFAVGAIAVLLPASTKRGASLLGWAGLAGICLAGVAFTQTTVFPGFPALLPALATAFALRTASVNPESSLVRVLSVEPLQQIGRLSYSWYLWHWPVLILGSAIIPAPSVAARAGLVALSLGISLASFHLVENPIRHNRRLASRPAYCFVMAGLIAVVGIAMSVGWRQASIYASEKPAQARFLRASADGPLSLTSKCSANVYDAEVKHCAFGVADSPISVVLIGDSHAAQWFDALEPISLKKGWKLVTMVKNGCAMVDAPYFLPLLGREYTECGSWRKSATEKIREMRPYITVVSSQDGYLFADQEWENGIEGIVKGLADASQNVVILRDTPAANFDVPTCLARRTWRPAFIPTSSCDVPLPHSSKVYDFQTQAAAQYKNVLAVDLTPNICPAGICAAETNGLITFRDANHLTGSFVKSLQGVLSEELNKAVTRGHTWAGGSATASARSRQAS